MRYQERIYPQTKVSAVRNKDTNIFNMSTDICIFEQPQYNVVGAGKINDYSLLSAYTYTITGNSQTIPFTFDFTANTNSFSANNATFRYEIYQYSNLFNSFSSTPVYKSEVKTGLDSITSFTDTITATTLNLDGDYLIKGYFNFPVCTTYLSKLNKAISTFNFPIKGPYGMYDKNLDFYFVAFKEAQKPEFSANDNGNNPGFGLYQKVITKYTSYSASGSTTYDNVVTLPSDFSGQFVLTVNGLVLAEGLDYTYSQNLVTLNDTLDEEDVVTVIYTTVNDGKLATEVIEVPSLIISGATDQQGINQVYYNTTTNKYEVYTNGLPKNFSNVILSLNGVVLANGIDYYQSVSNPYRIILVGEIVPTDVITIAYPPTSNAFGQIYSPDQTIVWSVPEIIKNTNGFFTLETSVSQDFSSIYYSATTPYIEQENFYSLPISFSGDAGTKYYTRVKNQKNYVDICGNTHITTKYSDTLVSVVLTNSINSY